MSTLTAEQGAAAEPLPGDVPRRPTPAWLLSLALHAVLVLAAAWTLQVAPRGAGVEADRSGGIVLVSQRAGEREYLHDGPDDDAAPGAGQATSTSEAALQELAAALPGGSELPVVSAGVLPTGSDSGPGAAAGGAGLPGIGELNGGGGRTRGLGSSGRAAVFGVAGEGSKFVYVFDRSGSMGGFQGRPLAAAKRELLASLASLESVHQFQIIFYNDRVTICNPLREAQPRLLFGTDRDKKLAADFVRGVAADGGTRRLEPLLIALRMRPDVIFFLSDADEPAMTASDFEQLRRANQSLGAAIHVIDFGVGPDPGGVNFLHRLASQHDGTYVYVDVTRLPASP